MDYCAIYLKWIHNILECYHYFLYETTHFSVRTHL